MFWLVPRCQGLWCVACGWCRDWCLFARMSGMCHLGSLVPGFRERRICVLLSEKIDLAVLHARECLGAMTGEIGPATWVGHRRPCPGMRGSCSRNAATAWRRPGVSGHDRATLHSEDQVAFPVRLARFPSRRPRQRTPFANMFRIAWD